MNKAAALLAAIAERKAAALLAPTATAPTAPTATLATSEASDDINSDLGFGPTASYYDAILRNRSLVPYNRDMFVAFWKWRLLHPSVPHGQFEAVLSCMSAGPVLGTFARQETLPFFPIFPYASLLDIQHIVSMLHNMNLTVPADIQQELFTFLVNHYASKSDAVANEESQTRTDGGLTGRAGFVTMDTLADKASFPESSA